MNALSPRPSPTDVLLPLDMEAEVLRTIETLMRYWEQRGEAAVDGFLAYVAEDFRGFGTGQCEHYPDRATLRAHTVHEHEQLPYAITFAAPWMQVRLLSPTLALAEGEFQVEVHMEPEKQVLHPRVSLLFEYRDSRWILLHFHFSLPNALQKEGDSLLELFKTRNRELEQEVIRRTAALERSLAELKATQAQLVQQEKMASLGTLTAGVAHEIKNPLNFVNNFASLSRELVEELVQELEAGTNPEAVQAILADLTLNTEKIEAHGRRADNIVHAMLEHARSGSRERRTVDLNALVTEHVDMAWHGKRARTEGFDAQVTKELGAVGQLAVVPQEIGRVVLNLMNNAFDAVGERAAREGAPYQPVVTVRTRQVEEAVEIRVEDNGPGIPEAIRAKVFEPFFTTKPTGSGTGLGLSLSYDIITQGHGGTLSVEGADGEGTAFIVRLPVATTAR